MAARSIVLTRAMAKATFCAAHGQRYGKTQTRQLATVAIYDHVNPRFSQLRAHREGRGWRIYGSEPASDVFKVPHAAGDRLWVKEKWRPIPDAMSECAGPEDLRFAASVGEAEHATSTWKRPQHLPRWGSRLTLIVEAVRVERLQAITEDDAIAEGCGQYASSTRLVEAFDPGRKGSYREGFRELWGVIRGAEAWAANPWVVVTTFRPVAGNIDSHAVEKAAQLAMAAQLAVTSSAPAS